MKYFSEVGVKISHTLPRECGTTVCAVRTPPLSFNEPVKFYILTCNLYLKSRCPSLCTLEWRAGNLKHSCWTWHLLIVTVKVVGRKWPNMSVKWAVFRKAQNCSLFLHYIVFLMHRIPGSPITTSFSLLIVHSEWLYWEELRYFYTKLD